MKFVEYENIFYLIIFIELLIILIIRGRINILKIRFKPI